MRIGKAVGLTVGTIAYTVGGIIFLATVFWVVIRPIAPHPPGPGDKIENIIARFVISGLMIVGGWKLAGWGRSRDRMQNRNEDGQQRRP